MGEGDLHDVQHHSTAVSVKFSVSGHEISALSEAGRCDYQFVFSASLGNDSQTSTSIPVIFAVSIAASFLILVALFLVYDHYVQRRNGVVADLAKRSVKILSTLFPASVRERMFADEMDQNEAKPGVYSSSMGTTKNLKSYLDNVEDDDEDEDQLGYAGKPIADLCKFERSPTREKTVYLNSNDFSSPEKSQKRL